MCEELGIPYELKLYHRDPETRLAPPEYQALTPFGTAPVITDGDLTLGESAAIIEYLIHCYGGGRLAVAPGEPGYSAYLFWFHFANGSLPISSRYFPSRPCGYSRRAISRAIQTYASG